jgi:NADPH-dependent glutamate synthase beta subunit-like oxidoreductase
LTSIVLWWIYWRSLPTKGIETKSGTSNGFLTSKLKFCMEKRFRSNKSYWKDVIVIGGGDTGSDCMELQIDMEQNQLPI